MKKTLLFLAILIASTSIFAEEEFQFLKGKYRYVSNMPFNGAKYDGFVDENGKPYIYGKLYTDKDIVYTQIKNGVPDGWMKMYLKGKENNPVIYSGIGKWDAQKKTCVPSGYGRQAVEFQGEYATRYASGDESAYEKGCLAFVFSYKGINYSNVVHPIYMKNGQQLSANKVYKTLLYDNKKQAIKDTCLARNIRYVEDVKISSDKIYTGGWKDAAPYYYGAVCMDNGPTFFVKVGNIEPYGYSFNMIGSYEDYNNGNYFSRRIVGSDTLELEFTAYRYEECRKSRNNEYKSYIWLNYSVDAGKTDDRYAQILKAKSETQEGKYWGIYVKEGSFFEGYLDFENGEIKPTIYGVTLGTDGEVSKCLSSKEHRVFSYPDGSRFEMLHEYTPKNDKYAFTGVYVLPDGNYVVGYFTKKHGMVNKNLRFNNFTASYAEEYNSNNQLVNTYMVEAKWDTEEHNRAIALMKNEYNCPVNGYHEYTYNNGDAYSGEWKDKKKDGEGKFVQKDKTVYNGIWKEDSFVRGTITYPDGKTYTGEVSNGEYNGQGKLTYQNGTYRDGLWESGRFLSGKVHLKYEDGKEYIGEWKSDRQAERQGVCKYKNGGYKKGFWKSTRFISGEGYLVYDDGTTFKGIWEYGYPKEGTFTLADGTKISRTQTLKDQGGNHVPNLSLHVDIIYPDGREYHGPCRGTQLEGDSAVVLDGNGNRYEGAWDQYGRAGKGVNIFANGDSINTTWEYDVYAAEAEFIYTWSDGRKFVGMCDKKGKIGKGVYYHPDGSEASKKEYKGWEMQIPNSVETPAIPKVATSVPQ